MGTFNLHILFVDDTGLYSSTRQLVSYLFVVALTIVLAYLCTRFLVSKLQGRQSRGEWFAVLDVHVLSRDNKLLLVKLGQKVAIISENSQGVRLLKELDEEEASSVLLSFAEVDGSGDSTVLRSKFGAVLKKQLELISSAVRKRDND